MMNVASTSRKIFVDTSCDEDSDSDSEVEIELKPIPKPYRPLNSKIGSTLTGFLPIFPKKLEPTKIVNEPSLFFIDTEQDSEKRAFLEIPEMEKVSTAGFKKVQVRKREPHHTDLVSKFDDGDIENPDRLYINMNWSKKNEKSGEKIKIEKKVEEVLKKSIITPEFHNAESVKPFYESSRAARKQRKVEREKTKGQSWFDMPAAEMTDEKKHDLEILMMRDALDTKSYYRKEDKRVLPKYFQVGTIIEDATDFYSDRLPKKQRKQTIVDELLADADFKRKNKARYTEIIKKQKLQQPWRFRKEKRSFKNDD